MRIAFVGKGGSGKTTTASLFAEYSASLGNRVLALDADINQHLASALGFNGKLRSMGVELDEIKTHLRGTNSRFSVAEMHKTTPPGYGSRFITLKEDDWFIKRYTKKAGQIMLAGAGDIPEGNVGVRCYHGLNGAVELVLGHLLDTQNDTVIVDMTAGADAFSSSLFAKVDALILVVEPTLKSLSVYDQFIPNVQKYDIPLLVVGNKIQDDEDRAFIEQKIGVLTACIGQSTFIRKRERGVRRDILSAESELISQLHKLVSTIRSIKRDWNKLERQSHILHQKNADEWIGEAATEHIDPTFSLQDFARKRM
jgi:CO dehydrogenase maturation factor